MPGRFQIKLSILFLLILVGSLPLGCIAYVRHQIDDFHRAAAPFEKVSGRRVQASGDDMAIVHGRYGLTMLDLRNAELDDVGLLCNNASRRPNTDCAACLMHEMKTCRRARICQSITYTFAGAPSH